ncbi:MAG: C40 family peptidase [Acidimicrobiales bacterium]
MRVLMTAGTALFAVAVILGAGVAVLGGALSIPAGGSASVTQGALGGTGGVSGDVAVPAMWEVLDRGAAATCPGLPWAVLAAIGRIESDSGRSTAPGVHSGANPAGAEGPMQFEPATFAAYATVGPSGANPPSPYDPVDAVYSAAALLCADGAARAAGLAPAVADYNHSTVYVDTVLVLAAALTADPTLAAPPATALAFAASQLGAPYLWGGTGTGGYDCSGLVQAAYRAAGVMLPRVAQDQFDAGPVVARGHDVQPGDLVFFGASASSVDHVGIYVGAGNMIDAPYTGTVVRVDPASASNFVGATRPYDHLAS